MAKPRISIIAVLGTKTRAIGKAGGLLWRIPGDLPRFKALTMGHSIIMGRKTYQSIGKVLPGRTNIVVTRNPQFATLGASGAKSLEQAFEIAKVAPGGDEIFVIGGGEIYAQALPLAHRLYLTLVDSDEPGDTFFPDYSSFTHKIHEEHNPSSTPSYAFVILERGIT